MLSIRGLGVVLGDLAAVGFDAEWGVLGASDAGAQHARKRIWILAHTNQVGWGRRGMLASKERKGIQPPGLVGKHGTWETSAAQKARVLGMGDGLAGKLDRLKAIGNGQVPAVVKLAWETLI
jgi:DNA (cytosine-5)-methyltransferase 1